MNAPTEASPEVNSPISSADGGRCASLARVRWVGLAVAVPCVAVLVMAVWLRPDSRGYDTHTQLGLSACGFMQTTGLPCPTCGMTTSFAYMAEGRPVMAVRTQAFGAVLFVLTAAAGGVGLAQLVTGRNLLGRFRPRTWWLWAGLAGGIAGWAIKLAAEVSAGG